MPTLSAHAPSSHPTLVKPDSADFEPDDEWKRQLKKRIEEGLNSMVKEVKDNQAAELRKAVVSQEARMRLEEDYKRAMSNIKAVANEQYQIELDRERNQRRWTAGAPMNAEWGRILAEEQQSIMNTIKQTSNQDSKAATETPKEERRPVQATKPEATAKDSPKPPRPAPQPTQSTPPLSMSREERPKPVQTPSDPPARARRGSDTPSNMSRDRDERPPSIRRQHGHASTRPTLPDDWDPSEPAEEPEDTTRSTHRSRPSADPPPSSSSETGRWDSSLGRSGSVRSSSGYTARSPPKPMPEIWKPTTTPIDEPSGPKPYNLGRRGSSTSMRSTGSGNSIRPTISETIPERADDVEECSSGKDRGSFEQDRARRPVENDRRGGRKNSRPTPVDPTVYSDEPPTNTPLRSAGSSSMVMQLATSSPSIKSVTSKSSFPNGDERYLRDQHPSSREPAYLPREPPYSARDAPSSARPVPSRSPYGPDDRDYGTYQNPLRPPKTPFREYGPGPHPPISHKSSFNYDDRRRDRDWDGDRERDHWDGDRDHPRERDYDFRDREWDRDRDRDRDLYSESRHPSHYPYSSRSGGYPTPPSSAARHTSHDYLPMNDLYDERDAPPPRSYGYRGSEDWEYQRPESARPVPTRQPSYSRRDDPERDPYSRPYPSSGSIPIPPRHAPSNEDIGPGWRDWGVEGGVRRPSDSRYDNYARSPPAPDPFPRRRPTRYSAEFSRDDIPPDSRQKKRPPRLRDDEDAHDDDDDEDDPPTDEEGKDTHSEEEDSSSVDEEELNAHAKKLEEERREADEKIKEKAVEIQRLQEEEKRLEEESRRKEEEVKRKEEEVRKKEEEAKRVEEELRRKEEEATKMAEEAKKKEEEAKRKEREAQKREKETKRKAEDAKKMALEAGRKAEEAKKKEAEVNRKEEQTRRKEEKLKEDTERTRKLQQEANRIAEEARQKQEALGRLEEETKRKELEIEERERALKVREEELRIREEEARRMEEDAWKKEEEARKKEADARRKELDNRRKEEEVRKKEEEARKKEEEAKRKDEEATKRSEDAERRLREEKLRREKENREEKLRREQEAALQDRVRREQEEREEMLRKDREARDAAARDIPTVEPEKYFDDDNYEVDARFIEEQTRLLQQAQFRKREEDIKRSRAEGRKREDSIGNDSAWALPGSSPGIPKSFSQFTTPPYSAPSPSPSGTSAAWTTWGTSSSTPKPPTAPTPSPARPTNGVPPINKPRNGSVSSGTYPTSTSPHSAAPISEAEWARRHAEFTNNQHEKFRREQEKLESERQIRSAGKPLTRDEIQRVFEHHDRLWTRLPNISELSWNDFPWPVLRPPSNPDDISFALVNAYFQSPFCSEKEKLKSLKDRIKDHLRRWHPDRFDSKTLPRVVDAEKETVKEGAGYVVRYLNDLLRKENESNSVPNLFGD